MSRICSTMLRIVAVVPESKLKTPRHLPLDDGADRLSGVIDV